jgi:hypothetical protein
MDWSCILGTSVKPYPHQQRTAEAFMAGKSVLLRAPTGSGKTEAIVGPFLHALAEGTAATPRLVYSLPLRVLATSLRDRVAQWAPDVPIMCQHGDEPQAALFHRPVVFTTVDQTIESFITCPPTLPRKLGNIAAGAVSGAVLAFDEVQLLDPVRALQSMMVLLEYQRHLDIPFFIATATLPDALADLLVERFGCEAPVLMAPPETVASSRVLVKRLKKGRTDKDGTYQGLTESFGIREYLHLGGPLMLWIGLPQEAVSPCLFAARYLRRLGTTDSLCTVHAASGEQPDETLCARPLAQCTLDLDAVRGRLALPLNDLGPKAQLDHFAPNTNKTVTKDVLINSMYVLPLAAARQGANWLLWKRVPFE